MAYRTAAFSGYPVDGLIILAGDLPPDVAPAAATLPESCSDAAPLGELVPAEKAATDLERLRAAGISATEHVFDAGHARHPSFVVRAGEFLDQVSRV